MGTWYLSILKYWMPHLFIPWILKSKFCYVHDSFCFRNCLHLLPFVCFNANVTLSHVRSEHFWVWFGAIIVSISFVFVFVFVFVIKHIVHSVGFFERLSALFTLFACILFDAFMADITLNFTTPFEFASALPFPIKLMDVMSASAAQEITTVETVRGEITGPINRAQRTGA